MGQILQMRRTSRRLLAMLLGLWWLAAQPLIAEERDDEMEDDDIEIEERLDPALQPLTPREIRQAITTLQSDDLVRMRLAESRRVRTVSVERHEENKDGPAEHRSADVVLYIYDTDETISAVVALGPSPEIEHLAIIQGQPPALATEELEEARRLALADPIVRSELRAAGIDERKGNLVITHMLVQPTDPDDPCFTHRCIILFFNMRDAVLNIEPIVDLTNRQVEVQ